MATIKMFTNTYVKILADADKPVLVDFWAEWCGPCGMLGPIMETISEELSDRLIVAKVNVDTDPVLAQKYGVMSIPTMILFVDGVQAHSFVGAMAKEDIVAEFIDFIPELPVETFDEEQQ